MSAFDDGRVGLWLTQFRPERLSKIAQFAGGMFTDCFLPRTTTAAEMQTVRGVFRPDGTMMKAQLWEIASGTAAEYVQRIHGDILRLKPGVVELDIEGADDTLAQYIRDTVVGLRAIHPTFYFRINIAPTKAKYLPFDLLASDPNLYVAEQTYYGDMSRVSEAEVENDVLDYAAKAGVNIETIRHKFQPCYGAAAVAKVRQPDGSFAWQRVLELPTVLYKGTIAAKLRNGLVFQDDLMADFGLL